MEKFCQSCGMSMGGSNEMYGTNADGSKNADYCKYCYENGKFTQECTMQEMIEICIPHMKEQGMTEKQAREMMNKFLPELKRWKK